MGTHRKFNVYCKYPFTQETHDGIEISILHVLLTVEREDGKHQSENYILVTALIFPKCILYVVS